MVAALLTKQILSADSPQRASISGSFPDPVLVFTLLLGQITASDLYTGTITLSTTPLKARRWGCINTAGGPNHQLK